MNFYFPLLFSSCCLIPLFPFPYIFPFRNSLLSSILTFYKDFSLDSASSVATFAVWCSKIYLPACAMSARKTCSVYAPWLGLHLTLWHLIWRRSFLAAGSWIKRCKHWGYSCAALRYYKTTYIDLPSIRYIGEDVYANHLAQVVPNILQMVDNALITHSLKYVAFSRSYDTLHPLTNFEYWFSKITFEQRFWVWRNEALFVNWHCVNIFSIRTRNY